MALLGIQMTWVVVKNLDQAIEFYARLGLTLKVHSRETGWAEFEGKTGSRLGVAQQNESDEWDEDNVKAGSNGVVTITVDNLEETTAEYSKNGVKLIGKSIEIPGEVKLQSFKDLDGNLFQLVQML